MLIHDATPAPLLYPTDKGRGYVPRDFAVTPVGFGDPPSEIPLIPQSEWAERIAEMETTGSRLSDIRGTIPSLDQGQVGYCWAHSTTHVAMLARAVANQPYVPLSAYAVAATIKKGADEGGWCGLSAQFIREKGVPAQSLWPQGDRNYRIHDKPEVWDNAALHKTVEDWVDLSKDVYDQNLSFAQVATCALSRIPGAVDFDWWGHSVCYLDLVNGAAQRDVTRGASGKLLQLAEFDRVWGMNHPVTGGFGLRIWNSWADSWGDRGTGTLTAQKSIPVGAVACRTSRVSVT